MGYSISRFSFQTQSFRSILSSLLSIGVLNVAPSIAKCESKEPLQNPVFIAFLIEEWGILEEDDSD